MRNLSSDELAGIEQRADLCFNYADRDALRAEDVASLVEEIRDLWGMRANLIARHRQALDEARDALAQLDARREPDEGDTP
jgi:hypothetical protein